MQSPSQRPRQSGAVTDPKQIAILMMSKQNAVNEAKDDLTLTIRSMMDGANQIVQAYAEQMAGTEEAEKKCAILGKTIADQKKQIDDLQKRIMQFKDAEDQPIKEGEKVEDREGPPPETESRPESEDKPPPGKKVRPNDMPGGREDGAGPRKT